MAEGSYDDRMMDWEREYLILCPACGEEDEDKLLYVRCPKCKRDGCIHWCKGTDPCDWCLNGEPDPANPETWREGDKHD